ncbi:MAG: P1 family peptidase [Acidimicrobiales bacterium]
MAKIEDIHIGHWTDLEVATGLTVFMLPPEAVVAAQPRGQNPGTLNVEIFGPTGSADHAAAIVLTGGSVLGLAAAAHLAIVLEQRNAAPGPFAVPMVTGAVVFDLHIGRRAWPPTDAVENALDAAVAAGQEALGCVGAGTGTMTGPIYGASSTTKGGFGRATATTAQGVSVAAWAVVNCVGSVMGKDGSILAGLRRDGVFVSVTEALAADPDIVFGAGRATTLVVVATDAKIDKRSTWRLAQAGHSGIAHAITPCATGGDGDTTFAVSTGDVPVRNMLTVEAVACEVTAEAIRAAILAATPLHGVPSATSLH